MPSGATLMLMALASHLEGWGAPRANVALCYGESGLAIISPREPRIGIGNMRHQTFTYTGAPAIGLVMRAIEAQSREPIRWVVRTGPLVRCSVRMHPDNEEKPVAQRFIALASSHYLEVVVSLGSRAYGFTIHAAWLWALGAPMLLTPVALRWRTRHLRRKGACDKCGYDLAGLPAGEPCPECGAP